MLKMLAPAVTAALVLASAASAEEVSLSAGHRLAAQTCGGCHNVDAKGQSPNPRAPPFRTLGAHFPFDGLRNALQTGMIVGHPQMPIIHLSPIEAQELIAYMKSLQSPQRQGRAGRGGVIPLK